VLCCFVLCLLCCVVLGKIFPHSRGIFCFHIHYWTNGIIGRENLN
jgi:hypothetical protein